MNKAFIEKHPKPRNDAEFAVFSEYVFGKPLSLMSFRFGKEEGSYEIKEDFESYFPHKLSQSLCEGYYGLNEWFTKTVFGTLYCGGIARAAYGQFKIHGYRNRKRLQHWIQSRRVGDSHPSKPNQLRPAFNRLAQRIRVEREQNDSR